MAIRAPHPSVFKWVPQRLRVASPADVLKQCPGPPRRPRLTLLETWELPGDKLGGRGAPALWAVLRCSMP